MTIAILAANKQLVPGFVRRHDIPASRERLPLRHDPVYMQCEVQIPLSIQINKSHVHLIVCFPTAIVRDTITIINEEA